MESDNEYIPRRKTKGSCGYDFYIPYDLEMVPGEWYNIDTGVRFTGKEAPRFDGGIFRDWVMMIFPRSGLGIKNGLRLKNTVGIIDKDYRDNIILSISVEKPTFLNKGDRFAQGIVLPYGLFLDEIEPEDVRTGGLGSTDNYKWGKI